MSDRIIDGQTRYDRIFSMPDYRSAKYPCHSCGATGNSRALAVGVDWFWYCRRCYERVDRAFWSKVAQERGWDKQDATP